MGTHALSDTARARTSSRTLGQLATHPAHRARHGLRPTSLPNLMFQAAEPRPYLRSLHRGEPDAEIRTPLSPWQETLLLAWRSTFRVGETSMAHEATPMLEGHLGHKHAPGHEAEPRAQGSPLSGWTKSTHMEIAMPRGPHPNPSLGFPVIRTHGSDLESLFGTDT